MDDDRSQTVSTPRDRATTHNSSPALHSDGPETIGATPTRPSRLLQARNARFSAKRLSVSRIGSKIAQRTKHGGVKSDQDAARSKENMPLVQTGDGAGPGTSQLPSMTSSPSPVARSRNFHESMLPTGLPVASQELVENRRVVTKRHSSPLIYQSTALKSSPASSTVSSNSSRSLRLREVSGNEKRTSLYDSPLRPDRGRTRLQKSARSKSQFDAENYIQHIEKELQQAQDALSSPTTNKSLQHQLRSARSENDRLKQELAEMRNTFEAEVKTTLEHKTSAEVELKRRVKLLEDELEGKASVIEELEYQHEEKRLDSGTLETLKATIERLEAEKRSIEEENRSMTKRNEVLSELLAMSPTKSRTPFELRSPVREKRPGRPMSLIIPRLPSSPIVAPAQSHATSSTTSSPLVTGLHSTSLVTEIAPLSLNASDSQDDEGSEIEPRRGRRQLATSHSQTQSVSDASISGSASSPSLSACRYPLVSSPVHEQSHKIAYKRKPRRFMHGSTQLKPLLLPTLRSDANSQSSASVLGSPRSIASEDQSRDLWDTDSYFENHPHAQLSNIQSFIDLDQQETFVSRSNSAREGELHPQTVDEILAQDMTSSTSRSEHTLLDDGCARSSAQERTVGFTGPGPSLTNEHMMLANNNSKTGRYEKHLHGSEKPHQSTLIRSEQDSESPEPSSPFDLEALQKLRLPKANFDRLPARLTTDNVGLSSAVPEPLFSPTSKAATKRPSITNADHSHAQTKPLLSTDYGNTQSKARLPSSIMSPTPMGSKQSSFLDTSRHRNSSLFHTRSDKDPGLRPSRSPLSAAAVSMSRSITPLEILNRRQFGAKPLAAFTIRTICTALSRCTAFVRDIKSDPLALARKVLANAWFANWKRFGGLSWWVLGLFLPQQIVKPEPQWDWDDFDAEEIAQRCCDEDSDDAWNQHETYPSLKTHHGRSVEIYAARATEQVSKPGWCKSIFLWGKFSIALMLAVGGAVVNGPADMMQDIDRRNPKWPHDPALCQRRKLLIQSQAAGYSSANALRHVNEAHSQDLVLSRRPPSRSHSAQLTHRLTSLGTSPRFSSQTLGHVSHLLANDDDWSPMDDPTLRPARSRRQHVGGIFEQALSDDAASTMAAYRYWSRTGSIDDGFLKWPPDLDSVRSNCET